MPASELDTLAESKRKFYEDDLQDPSVAEEVAEHYLRDLPDEPFRESKKPAGIKRVSRQRHISALPGNQHFETDKKIRGAVALRYQGFSDIEIEKLFNVSRKYINELERKYPKAFDAAEADMVKSLAREYWQNVAVVRAALGRAGPTAVETLVGVMEDKDASPYSRQKAAKDVLTLLDIAGPKSIGGFASSMEAVTKHVETIFHEMKDGGDKESYVLDTEAEDAEVVDGNNVDAAD